DVLTNINIPAFFAAHAAKGGLATLAVRDRDSSRKLVFDDKLRLQGRSTEEFSPEGTALAFSGYHIIDPKIFNFPTRSGKFSITDWYLDLCPQHQICAYPHDQDLWMDIGRLEHLDAAQQMMQSAKF